MNERIRELRKALGLTMDKFGERLGVGKGAISAIENAKRNPSDQLLKSICREFHVSEDWLRSGAGEMMEPKPSGVVGDLVKVYKLNNFEAAFLDSYLKLSQEDRQGFCRYVIGIFGDVLAKLSSEDLDALAPYGRAQEVDVVSLLQKSPADMTEAEVEALEAEFHREILQEKEAAAGSSASSGSAGSQNEKRKKA